MVRKELEKQARERLTLLGDPCTSAAVKATMLEDARRALAATCDPMGVMLLGAIIDDLERGR